MLILTRKLGETINIGDDVSIQVLDIKGKQVRLGIKAPRDLSIHRKEIYLKIKSENIQAAETSPESLESIGEVWRDKESE